MSEADYVVALDDSGGVEPLVKWGGKFKPGDHPITVMAFLFIKSNHLAEFEDRWIELRKEIQTYLECPDLPPIHLRLMYGRSLPVKYRGKPNPYFVKKPPFEKLVEWLDKGMRILDTFSSRRRVLGTFTLSRSRISAYDSIGRYFAEPQFVAELQFLKENSKGKREGMAQKYLNRMVSPLLPLMTEGILFIDEQMRLIGKKSAAVKIDRFAEAHGLDPRNVLNAIDQVSELKHISSIEVMSDSDEHQLSQAVDLVGYLNFRKLMGRDGHIDPDPVATALLNNRLTKHLPSPNLQREVQKRCSKVTPFAPNSHYAITVPIHYAVARGAVEAVDPDFAREYLVEVSEIKERAKELMKRTRVVAGLSMLKDPSVCAHLLKESKNGDDPG